MSMRDLPAGRVVARDRDARFRVRGRGVRLHLRRATQPGLQPQRRAQRRRRGGRASRFRSANGQRRGAAAARVLRRSLARLSLATQRVDLPAGRWEEGRVRQRGIRGRGGETDDARRWSRARRRRSGHPACPERICGECARIVAHARTRTSRRRPRTRHRRRPAGTSPSRGWKGADALPTRALTQSARDVLNRF